LRLRFFALGDPVLTLMNRMEIRIGTRGSKLALWQAKFVQTLLESSGMKATIKEYKTEGDLVTDLPLSVVGGAGLFTKVLDEALLRDEIDLAVHSSKDIPTAFDTQLQISAILKREDPRDAFLAPDERVDLDDLAHKLVVGTSSPRRKAFMHHYLPHCEVKDIRGNVDTRIAKMEAGDYSGIVLAMAGVKRLGLEKYVRRKMNPMTFTPAPGQGAVAVMSRVDYAGNETLRECLNDAASESEVKAERAFLTTLGGGCAKPIFALATAVGNSLSIQGGVSSPDGGRMCRETVNGLSLEPEAAGNLLAAMILKQGGKELLYGQNQEN
jgi:hydroxymethylbilane synthase